MSGLDKLKEIGAHKIYEQTHIAKKFVQDILNEDFSSLNKMQFSGFISILEREYNVDLKELTQAYGLPEKEAEEPKKEPFVISSVDESASKKSNKIFIYVGIAIIAVVVITLLNFSTASKKVEAKKALVQKTEVAAEVNNTTIQAAKDTLTHLDKDNEQESVVEEERVEPVHHTELIVRPRSKLWVGIVNLDTFKRSQKLGSTPFELDANQEWLLVMGHGFVDFEVNGEEKSFKNKNKVWYAYENGTLTEITRAEFKEKNRGKAW